MKIAIIGAGQMGGYYANNLVTKLGYPASDIAVHDRDFGRALALQTKYGVVVHTEFPPAPDAAIVATNTPSHHEIVVQLVEQGVKHILVEKPVAQTTNGAKNILDHAGDAYIYTALVINFSPAVKYLQGRMESDKLALLDYWGRWGKNRGAASEKRPTAGDLEDEAIHPIGVLFALMQGGHPYKQLVVSASVGWLPYVNEESQAAARERDSSFPNPPNHSSSLNLRFINHGQELKTHVHSSFLLPSETRLVGGIVGQYPNKVECAFEIAFDQKRPDKTGGAVDLLKIVHIRQNESEQHEFAGDKLNDLTKAFVEAAQGGAVDPHLTRLSEAKLLVSIAEMALESDLYYGDPQTIYL